MAPDPDAVPLYVTEPGSVVGIDGGRLYVSKHREELVSVRLLDVLHVCAYGNVQVTAQAMRELFARDGSVDAAGRSSLPSNAMASEMRALTVSASPFQAQHAASTSCPATTPSRSSIGSKAASAVIRP